jgi:hypothetical protein
MGARAKAVEHAFTAGQDHGGLLSRDIEQGIVGRIEAQDYLSGQSSERGGHCLKSINPWADKQQSLWAGIANCRQILRHQNDPRCRRAAPIR